MLNPLIAHVGQAPQPHDLWSSWNPDPLLLGAFAVAILLYFRGLTHGPLPASDRWRARAFTTAIVALGLALLTPLEPLSRALASGHMVQHILLVLVAAPLLAFSSPTSTLLRGSPLAVRRGVGRWRRRLHLHPARFTGLRNPVAAWLLHVATVWIWHSAVVYDAALRNEGLHVLEHVTFVATGVLFWRCVVGSRSSGRQARGLGVLLVFGMAMQGVFLSALLTFAREPWYAGYAETTSAWGLLPLEDQQLAGALMWISGGVVYVVVALLLLASWIQAGEREVVR